MSDFRGSDYNGAPQEQHKEQPDDCGAAFDAWATQNNLPPFPDYYRETARQAWNAAWDARKPERESVNLAIGANAMVQCKIDPFDNITDSFRTMAKACADAWGLQWRREFSQQDEEAARQIIQDSILSTVTESRDCLHSLLEQFVMTRRG